MQGCGSFVNTGAFLLDEKEKRHNMNEADKLFEDIRHFVENGGDINAFYKDKSVL
jgi:hypothetical protein